MPFFDDDPRRRSIHPHRDLDPTYARPQPWFVGNGRGLMIVVLSLVGLLLVARVVSTVWLAEAAWTWWQQNDDRKRSHNPADWITTDDYPVEALRQHQQGTVRIAWRVSANGRVSDCWTVRSSGFVGLDRAACKAIVRSGRYEPVSSDTPSRTDSRRVVWTIPD